jgi:diguanylate cyclase (GGDEF)-like protein
MPAVKELDSYFGRLRALVIPIGWVSLVLVLITASLHGWRIARIAETEAALDEVIELGVSIDRLTRSLNLVESGFGTYRRAPKPAHRDHYRIAASQVDKDLKALAKTLEAKRAHTDQLSALVDTIETALAPLRDLMDSSDADADADAHGTPVLDGVGLVLHDARIAMSALADSIDESMRQASRQHAAEVKAGRAAFLLSMGLNVGFIALMLAWYGWSSRRASALHDQAQQQNARLAFALECTARVHDGLQGASRMGRELQQCHDLDAVLSLLREQLPRHMAATDGALYLLDDRDSLSMRLVFSWGRHVFVEKLLRHECTAMARTESPTPCPEVVLPCAHLPSDVGAGSGRWLCETLLANDVVHGALTLCQPQGETVLNDLDTILVEQTSLTLGSLAIRESLREQSVRDSLTGLYNRRFLEEALRQELSRMLRAGTDGLSTHLVAMMLDVDHFKRVNDRHGHEVGDRVLKGVAQVLNRQVRAGDVLARFGGEEFTILLVDVDPEIARARAELIRKAVEHGRMVEGHDECVTVSMGVAVCLNGGLSAEGLLSRADEALYLAKRRGRNQVVCAWDAQTEHVQAAEVLAQ